LAGHLQLIFQDLYKLQRSRILFDVIVAGRGQAAIELERTGELGGGESFTPEVKELNKNDLQN
jgi:hypothetical protein